MIEHLEAYFADFGVDASIGGVSCRGIFDAAYRDALGMASNQPQILVAAADLPDLCVGQSVILSAGSFVVREIQPDSTGMTTLVLESA